MIALHEHLPNQSNYLVWDKPGRGYQTGPANISCHRKKDQTPTLCPLYVLQQTESISQLFLAAHSSESATGTHEKAQVFGSVNQSHRAFAQTTNIATKPQSADGTLTSVPRHDAEWTALCSPNQRKSAHQAPVSYVVFPLEGIIQKTLRQCVVYKLRGRGFTYRIHL